ncbi:MAG: ATPase family associated with various cellular activities (AAA) [Candidatus Latescibacteria bacterium ADurb.Bin168]|nr:MAG: ATPase family associated with various cellular activities (AAA) [Candidatus Latescibacteria bacterium ADurb.Bin168]
MPLDSHIQEIHAEIERESEFVERIVSEIGKVIVGQRTMVERMLIGLLCDGHILLEGVPGLAKTLAVSSLARTIRAKFQRIQFTPDLLPADVVGTPVYEQKKSTFTVKKGPIFANIVLADEVNRAPAKVQSAMLEAMQEHQVTIGDQTFALEDPFLVLATQNPIEQEGTYPLPEAQIDRFMLKVVVTYPSKAEERQILDRMTEGDVPQVNEVVEPADIIRARQLVRRIYMDEKIKNYIVEIVCATRKPAEYGLADYTDFVDYGASPRATIWLALASKAHAFLRHRGYVTPEDVKAIGMDVLRHRVIPTYEAEAEEVTAEAIVGKVFDTVEVP